MDQSAHACFCCCCEWTEICGIIAQKALGFSIINSSMQCQFEISIIAAPLEGFDAKI